MGPNKIDRALQVAIFLLLAALGAVIAQSFKDEVIGVGARAPDFRIVADNGRTITPHDFGGKLLVLNFWATWCPPCVEEVPSLDALQRRLAARGVVVLGVSVDEDESLYRSFLDKAKVSFLTARDPSARISSAYGTYKFPETYVIDQRGRVVQKHIGPRDWTDESLVRSIEALL